MKKACLVVDPPYNNGEIFNRHNEVLNRDNCLQFFHFLQDEMRNCGYDLQTQDIHSCEQAEVVFYNDIPKKLPESDILKKSAVLIFESELIKPDNWKTDKQKLFWKVFTWNDQLVDNRKFFKFNFSHAGKISFKSYSERKKLATLVAGNKMIDHPLELYSKRREVIRWFEANHPQDFEFYGMGWDVYNFSGFLRPLNRIRALRYWMSESWPSYRGTVQDKLKVMSDYKFSICFENARDISGYITEKIFDSMSAGCIPVYWGAPNIHDFVPELCFVDMRKFSSYESLYKFLNEMSSHEYSLRLQMIEDYLRSPKHSCFEPAYIAKKVVSETIIQPI